ncbi:uncharacterized protein B0H64DRAFT_371814 [Chaetomium fimeti]|uniref:Uncharacterized protein n=1 Tax=Chaetomium fimeti TaxID=1854472 RepID=A0AAE0HNH3_9PEZI|nr:hypothetical protein B0H64DRAFT_371814 [Chaetomium fimeti]
MQKRLAKCPFTFEYSLATLVSLDYGHHVGVPYRVTGLGIRFHLTAVVDFLASICLHVWKQASPIICNGFEKANGEPYKVPAPDGRCVFVASPKYIKEMNSAPDTLLPLQAAAKHMLQPIYTIHTFN